MLDAAGTTAISLVHMEYHGWSCANVSLCTNSNGGDCALEAIQQFESVDGGWSWAPSGGAPAPANLAVVSPYTYEQARDEYNHSEIGFGDPSPIVRGRGGSTDADAWYVLVSASNPPIGINSYSGLQQRGQCLLRSATPRDHTSWRAWDGADFTVAFANPYAAPIANLSAHVCAVVPAQFIIVSLGWSARLAAWTASGFGSYTYANGTHIPCCGAWLYATSPDLRVWGQPQLIRPCKQEGQSQDWEYDPSFLDPASPSRNWHEELGGDEWYVYYWQARPDLDPRARSVYRQKVSLPAAAAAAAAAP
jgi:hypothetical protein